MRFWGDIECRPQPQAVLALMDRFQCRAIRCRVIPVLLPLSGAHHLPTAAPCAHASRRRAGHAAPCVAARRTRRGRRLPYNAVRARPRRPPRGVRDALLSHLRSRDRVSDGARLARLGLASAGGRLAAERRGASCRSISRDPL